MYCTIFFLSILNTRMASFHKVFSIFFQLNLWKSTNQWMTESMFFTLGRNWKLLICTQITYLCTLLVSFYILTFLLSLFHFIPLFHLDTLKIRQLNLDMMRHTCKNLIPMVVKRAMANSSKNHALLMCRILKMGWNFFSSLDIRENPLFVLFPAYILDLADPGTCYERNSLPPFS